MTRGLLLSLLIYLPVYCAATSFANASVENVNGGIQVNFTLISAIPDGTSYIILTECVLYDMNDTSNDTVPMTLSCVAIDTTELQSCCDDCVTNGSSQGYMFVEGPVTAGDEYSCSLFGFLNGTQDYIEAGNIIPLIGIPSLPGFEVLVESNGALNISIGSEYNGSSDDLVYELQIENEGSVVHEENYTAMNFQVDPLGNGEFAITAWAINEYGTSESEEMNVTVNITTTSTTAVSASTTSTVTVSVTNTSEPNENDANVAAIVGGVVGGVVVLIAFAVAIVITIVVILIAKKNKTGNIVKVVPME